MLKERTKAFAVRVIRLSECISCKSWAAKRLADQLLRAGTSIGAQYAEALGARSDAEFIAKVDGSLQELHEVLYWIDLIKILEYVEESRILSLIKEAEEIRAMLIASSKTVKLRRQLETAKKMNTT